jgi:hypothetical protein
MPRRPRNRSDRLRPDRTRIGSQHDLGPRRDRLRESSDGSINVTLRALADLGPPPAPQGRPRRTRRTPPGPTEDRS